MKKIFFLPLVIFAWGICLPVTAAVAQDNTWGSIPTLNNVQQPKPVLTSPLTVALTYYKLTARAPDFQSWVKQQDSYKNANAFDQPAIMDNTVQKMKDTYNAILLTEPLIVETQVQLSLYDAHNQGFFVENFKESTFFPASYAGQSYAIVPQDIVDKKWLKVDDPGTAAAIAKAAAANNQMLTMVLSLTPRYADTSAAVIGGENYWPIAVDVKNMMLYQPGSDILLWQSNGPAGVDKTRQYLLNLYQ